MRLLVLLFALLVQQTFAQAPTPGPYQGLTKFTAIIVRDYISASNASASFNSLVVGPGGCTGCGGGGGSSSPSTPFGSVQFNNGGSFGGSSGLTYVTATTTLIANTISSSVFNGGTFNGNGSGLNNVAASSVPWSGVSGVPLPLQAVSNGTPISLTGLSVNGTLSGSSLISTSAGGVVSGTYGYFSFVSATLAGNGAGITGVTAGSVSWSGITGIPTGVQNISNATGSVTATVFAATQVTTTNISASLLDATRSGTVSATYGYFGNISGSGAGITGVVASSVNWYSVLRIPGAVAAVSNNGIVSLTGISTTSNQASFTTVYASGIATLASGSNIIGGLAVSNTGHTLALKQTADAPSGGLALERPTGGATFGEVWEDSNGLNLRTNSQNNNKLIMDASGVGLGVGVLPNARLDVGGNISASNVYVTGTTGTISAAYGYFTNISGSGAGITNVVASSANAVTWTNITGVPAGVANVSNATGSVTLTTISATSAYATTTSGTYGYFTFVSGTTVTMINGVFTNVAGTLSTAAQPNITSTGGLTIGGTVTPTLYGINTSTTASTSEVLYVSGTRIDGALGLCYNNVSNSVFIGTPTGVGCPASPSSTLQVSGTFISSGLATLTNVSATGGISVTGNASAAKFIGDGSLLTGISAGGSTDKIISGTSSIQAISASTTVSAVVGNENIAWWTSKTYVVSGTISATNYTGNGGNLTVSKGIFYSSVSGTFTTPATITSKTVFEFILTGGGGAGGIGSSINAGGGAGATCKTQISSTISAGTGYTYAIGNGGIGAAVSGKGVSTTITIGAITYTAGGGNSPTVAASSSRGGLGGTALSCDANYFGGDGQSVATGGNPGGVGGASIYGTGGRGSSNSEAGTNGRACGSGGGGGSNSNAGNGANGCLEVRWW